MPFKLVDVDFDKDFEALIECQWVSYERPAQDFYHLFFPILGSGPDARAESIKEGIQRQREWHNSDPTSRWHKVVNDEGTIVGGVLWKICPTNPFAKPDEHGEAYWFPEGGQRDYVSAALERFDAARMRMGARPQIYPNIIFTHPDHRRQGIADVIMKWGTEKADEMGVEMWLDSTPHGVPVYEKHGFTVVNTTDLRPTTENPSEEWKALDAKLGPMIFKQMWRPIGGGYVEGQTPKPWEQ